MDYIPNVENLENSVLEVRRIPPPRWFVKYYRNGCGNFIHASWYLAKEIGTIPEGNLKKYGKGVLVRAKDITQARMLQHLPCPTASMFETVKAHPTFNYSKGCVYSQDFYGFPEEEILAMCPSSVQKVTKMKNSSNIVLLTFFYSTLPDRVHIGLINLRCFSCYGYGHGKSSCKEASRCGNCSEIDSHSEEHCNAAAYCFHCRDTHQTLAVEYCRGNVADTGVEAEVEVADQGLQGVRMLEEDTEVKDWLKVREPPAAIAGDRRLEY
ncbi:hypothetical protein E2C01_024025 [Portunus trituberculatus]|uniref:Uncharacterized protein n=1 Tax=Portunus trituberculatus TaxID=210409 RepID=A0A5B7EC36_PORTR|nr:hypothetical protein [Portunus trituberculatus]